MLTDREFYILFARRQGMTQEQIAKELKITQGVVSRAEANAREKVLDAQKDLARLARLSITIKEEQQDDDLLARARRRKS